MDEKAIKKIVCETIKELNKGGFLKPFSDFAYGEINTVLTDYYNDSESDLTIKEALKHIEKDPYYKIIPLYFNYQYTIEKIAEILDVEVSTIVRNKKRLCLMIYNAIQEGE